MNSNATVNWRSFECIKNDDDPIFHRALLPYHEMNFITKALLRKCTRRRWINLFRGRVKARCPQFSVCQISKLLSCARNDSPKFSTRRCGVLCGVLVSKTERLSLDFHFGRWGECGRCVMLNGLARHDFGYNSTSVRHGTSCTATRCRFRHSPTPPASKPTR